MFHAAGMNASTWNIGTLSNWNTANVTTTDYMFGKAGLRATSFNLDLSNWNVSNVTNMTAMFSEAGRYAGSWSIGNLSNWDTKKVTSMGSMFAYAGSDAGSWASFGSLDVYASAINDMFRLCTLANAVINIYNNPTNYTNTFYYASRPAGSSITVNYSSAVTDIDNIIATKTSGYNVFKGVQLD